MSLAIPVLPVSKVLDPRVRVNNRRVYAVLKGGVNVGYTTVSASTLATNGIQFTCNPPNPTTIVSRKVYHRWSVQLSFTGTGSPLLNLGLDDGFRSFPISSVIQNLTANINNGTVTSSLNQYIQPYLHFNNSVSQQDYDLSMTPDMLDQYQNYSDYVTLGSARNPLAAYGENSTQQTRGGFPITVVSNTTNAAVIQAVLTEPTFVAPFIYGSGEQSGFMGVQTMAMNITTGYGSLGLNYMWSHASTGNAISNLAVTFTAPPQVLFTYISPDPLENVPLQISYPYFTIVNYPQPTISLTPGSTGRINFNTVQVPNVPNRIYMWARQQASDATITSTDTYANISGLQVDFANKQGIFSSATEQDLYQMSVRNGLNMSWAQWKKYQGSIICIDPSLDLGLASDMADGVTGVQNLQPQMTINNINTTQTINYTPWLSVVTEGVFTIANQQAIQSTSVLTAADVLTAQDSGLDLSAIQKVEKLIGGNFISDIGNFLKDAYHTARPIVEGAIDVGKKIAPLLPLVGLGARKRQGGNMIHREQLQSRNY